MTHSISSNDARLLWHDECDFVQIRPLSIGSHWWCGASYGAVCASGHALQLHVTWTVPAGGRCVIMELYGNLTVDLWCSDFIAVIDLSWTLLSAFSFTVTIFPALLPARSSWAPLSVSLAASHNSFHVPLEECALSSAQRGAVDSDRRSCVDPPISFVRYRFNGDDAQPACCPGCSQLRRVIMRRFTFSIHVDGHSLLGVTQLRSTARTAFVTCIGQI